MADPLIRMELPWPSKDLSPNGRVHWSRKARAARAARRLGHLIAANAGARNINLPAGRIHLHIDFYPPTRRLPDDDNMLTRCKPYRDGIADALGIDDARFISHPLVHAQPRAGGLVVIRVGVVGA